MVGNREFDYFYGAESDQFSFYRIPRLLVTGRQFKDLSTDAKLLYGLLLDRMGLSAKNGWYDEQGRVFIYYPLNEIEENLNCGHNKAIRLVAELDQEGGIGLIERRRQGQGRPSVIYVKRFTETFHVSQSESEPVCQTVNNDSEVSNTDVLKFRKQTSRRFLIKSQVVSKANANYTDKNHTYLSIPIESYQSDGAKNRESCLQTLRQRIDYDRLLERFQQSEVDEMLELIAEVLCSTNATIRVNGSQIPIRYVKERFQTLDRFHIEYVIDCLRENTTNVRNIRAYLLTTLYNAPVTIDHYYQAKVQHDLYGQ